MIRITPVEYRGSEEKKRHTARQWSSTDPATHNPAKEWAEVLGGFPEQ
jgi:hypothetical protein